MRKTFLIICLILFLAPFFVQAGIVPCGRPDDPTTPDINESTDDPDTLDVDEGVYCQLCHIFVLFDNILKFIFFTIVPPLAILMIAIGSLYFLFSMGDPGKIAQGKSILRSTAIALLIIYGAWLIVDLILTFPGLIKTDFSDWHPSEWFQIRFDPPCPGMP